MNIKIIKFIWIFYILICIDNLYGFSGGSGTETDPYIISNIQDIDLLRDSVSMSAYIDMNWSVDKHFELSQNIADSVREPIGDVFF